jgi:hypothetical protein
MVLVKVATPGARIAVSARPQPDRVPGALGLIGIGALVAAVISLPGPALAEKPQPTAIELVSKRDARKLFATPRHQWKENVRRAAASGMAVPLRQAGSRSVGMSVRAAGGAVSTLLRYDAGDARPTAVMFVMWYDSPDAQNLTDAFARRIVATVTRQMAPEFHVMGETDRLETGVASTSSSPRCRDRLHGSIPPRDTGSAGARRRVASEPLRRADADASRTAPPRSSPRRP